MTSSIDILPQQTKQLFSFGNPMLTLTSNIGNFSIDQRIIPKKEIRYLSIAKGISDDNFHNTNSKKFDGLFELHITPHENDFLDKFFKSSPVDTQCALSIIEALHNTLINHPNLMISIRDKPIVIPVRRGHNGNLYPCLRFDGDSDKYYWDYCSTTLPKGSVYFAYLGQKISSPNN